MKPERRCLFRADAASIETREGGKPVIAGYAARYYDPSDAGTEYELYSDPTDGFRIVERILPGAFDRAMREDDVRALFNHDADNVLGRAKAGTLRLYSDARGLRYEITPPDTQTARDLMESLRRGDVSGSSFAFDPRAESLRKSPKLYVRELTDVGLYDVGPVTYPAYTGTDAAIRAAFATTIEGFIAECLRERREAREAAARDADDLTLLLAAADAETPVDTAAPAGR